MTLHLSAYVRPLRAGNIGANPREWEIEPLDAPIAEPFHAPAGPDVDPVHAPAEPAPAPDRQPVPA